MFCLFIQVIKNALSSNFVNDLYFVTLWSRFLFFFFFFVFVFFYIGCSYGKAD